MQRGSLVKSKRKQGPEVWQFRWSEKGPNTKRVYRRRVIGTVEQYPDEAAARRAVEVLVSEINSQQRIARCNPLTIAQLGLERSKSSPGFGIFRWQEVPALNSEI